jgi:hypothetical protein
MMKTRLFYEAIVKASPPDSAGSAIKKKLPFEKIDDESIGAVAEAVVNYEKALTAAVKELEAQPSAPPSNGAEKAEKRIDVVPDSDVEVLAPSRNAE